MSQCPVLHNVFLSSLHADPPDPDDDLSDLVADIRRNGLLTPPVVWHNGVVDGRRRYEACRRLGWRMIPVGVLPG